MCDEHMLYMMYREPYVGVEAFGEFHILLNEVEIR